MGGEFGLEYRRQLDSKKRQLAKNHGTRLIEWHYATPILAINLIVLLTKNGITSFPKPDITREPKTGMHLHDETEKVVFEIRQYELDGRYKFSYKTYKDASMASGIADKQIQKAATGYRKTAGGFQWRRCANTDENADILPIHNAEQTNQSKPVYQVSKDGEVLARFDSVNSAARQTGIDRRCISSSLSGAQKSAGGYFWVYGIDD